jgi:hypothetical protein
MLRLEEELYAERFWGLSAPCPHTLLKSMVKYVREEKDVVQGFTAYGTVQWVFNYGLKVG